MNPIRALNFDDDSSSISGDIPTTNASVDVDVVVTSLDCGKKLVTSLDNGRTRNKHEDKKEDDDDDDDVNEEEEEEEEDCFISQEEKFKALQTYVKGLSLDEWIYT